MSVGMTEESLAVCIHSAMSLIMLSTHVATMAETVIY